jgi:hypothetical protein
MNLKEKFDLLVGRGLVKCSASVDGELLTYKYGRNVFWGNLWKEDPLLVEARGIVLNKNGEIAQIGFQKVFNLFENNTLVGRDRRVLAIRKLNGFLGVASIYNERLLVSTTGSTDSNYVELARRHLDKPGVSSLLQKYPQYSFMFEIVAPDEDPHIVNDPPGAYLIGARKKEIGSVLVSEETLDEFHDNHCADEVMRPSIVVDIFDVIRRRLKGEQHEGYMIRDAESDETLCKVKSDFYLSKKALMRLGRAKTVRAWKEPLEFKKRLDEEFYPLWDYVNTSYSAEQWQEMTESERKSTIESFFKLDR